MTRTGLPLLLTIAAVVGCSKPNATNIALRKQLQHQADEIETLKRQHAADVAQANVPAATQSGSATRPAELFTTHGVRIGKLTRAKADSLSVHVVPFDDTGDDFKAAGAITVDAYDLTGEGRRLGHWRFDAAATRPMWIGHALRYEYVVPCPWPQPPSGKELTVKVTFVDALTGRSFDAQQTIAIQPE